MLAWQCRSFAAAACASFRALLTNGTEYKNEVLRAKVFADRQYYRTSLFSCWLLSLQQQERALTVKSKRHLKFIEINTSLIRKETLEIRTQPSIPFSLLKAYMLSFNRSHVFWRNFKLPATTGSPVFSSASSGCYGLTLMLSYVNVISPTLSLAQSFAV